MRTYDEAYEHAVDQTPFSNGTESFGWMGNWCGRCLRDAPFRNGIAPSGCPLIKVALMERTPSEWLDGPRDAKGRYSIEDQYHCVEFRAPGGGHGEPRPKPGPRGMNGLFPAPERSYRRLTPNVEPNVAPTPGTQSGALS